MPDWSRRHALQAAASAGAFALAGCSGASSRSDGRDLPPLREPVTPLSVRFVRDADGERIFEVDDGPDERRGGFEYLATEEDRTEVSFRSSPAAAALREFVDATAFGTESVYLVASPIGACYEARLVGVYREGDGIDAEFCEALRPADVACGADDEDTVGVGVRLPFAEESFNSFGMSWGGDCRHEQAIASEGGDGA